MTRPLRAGTLFAILFAAALAATVLVLASRSPDLVLEVTGLPQREVTPNGDGQNDMARIAFFVRESDPEASVYIVGQDLVQIRALDEGVELTAGEELVYRWDTLTDGGAPAPSGRYRLRVVLPSRDRDMVFPRRFEVDRAPGPLEGVGE